MNQNDKSRSAKRAKNFFLAKKGLAPTSLSKASTPLSDDPAWDKILDVGGVAMFMEEITDNRFLLEGKTYDEFQSAQYIELANQDQEYRKTVSDSMAAYHAVLASFVRTNGFLKEQGRSTPESAKLVEELTPTKVVVPEPVGRYLAGIGNTTDGRGIKHIPAVDVPGTNTVSFDFIKPPLQILPSPSANTISDWCSIPQPAVYLARIAADYRYTLEPTPQHRLWRIPGVSATPNRNLPGWRPARLLSINQHRWLAENGWTYVNGIVTIPEVSLAGFSLNPEIFWRVNTLTSRIKSYRMTVGITTDSNGSSGQLAWLGSSSNDLLEGRFRTESSEHLDTRANLIALHRGYRWRRTPDAPWLPFNYPDHNTFKGHENDRFLRYESSSITAAVFHSAVVPRAQLATETFRKFRINANKSGP